MTQKQFVRSNVFVKRGGNIMISIDNYINLYEIYRRNLVESLKLFQETARHYMMIIIVISGGIFTGIYVHGESHGLLLLIACIVNAMICLLAVKNCDRFYIGFLEDIAITGKIEEQIGLLTRDVGSTPPQVFRDDDTMLMNRWQEGRKRYTHSQLFVDACMKEGANKYNHQTFHLLAVLNLLLFVYIIVLSCAKNPEMLKCLQNLL